MMYMSDVLYIYYFLSKNVDDAYMIFNMMFVICHLYDICNVHIQHVYIYMYFHFNIHVLILFHQDPAPVGVIHQFPTESPWDSHWILFISKTRSFV